MPDSTRGYPCRCRPEPAHCRTCLNSLLPALSTTGGGGAPTYPFVEDEDNIICIRRLHHLLIHVSPERLEVIAIASDDEELDRFTVERDITRTAHRLPIRLDRLLRGRFFGESADAIYPMGTGHDSSEP